MLSICKPSQLALHVLQCGVALFVFHFQLCQYDEDEEEEFLEESLPRDFCMFRWLRVVDRSLGDCPLPPIKIQDD